MCRLYSTVHVLVGTPGRIRDLADKGACDLSKVTVCALDEVSAGALRGVPCVGAWA